MGKTLDGSGEVHSIIDNIVRVTIRGGPRLFPILVDGEIAWKFKDYVVAFNDFRIIIKRPGFIVEITPEHIMLGQEKYTSVSIPYQGTLSSKQLFDELHNGLNKIKEAWENSLDLRGALNKDWWTYRMTSYFVQKWGSTH